MPSEKYWEMLDDTPDKVSETAGLVNWSLNCEYPTPLTLFMDITGISEDEYGTRLCETKFPNMGFVEIGYLADALQEYASNPSEVKEWLSELFVEEAK
jgi:hypothetical protein